MEGRCQCGLITFVTPGPEPLRLYVCHCTECRHQSSSAFGISALFPSFIIADPGLPSDQAPKPGAEKLSAIGIHTRQTRSHRPLQCLFCKRCGSRLQHVVPGEKRCTVKGGCLELTKEMMRHAIHIWTKEAIVEISPAAEQWEEEPPED